MTHLVRPAGPEDLSALPVMTVEELARSAQVLVAGEPVVGSARIEVVDGDAHLEQLWVHPEGAGHGIGAALLEASAEWAALSGHEWLTVCTFADVPGIGAFYARHGFEPVAHPGPGLRALREAERRLGLDAVGRRVALRRGVGPRAVLAELAAGLASALGPDLLGLYAHGSLVAGDFAAARSDLDALAVVERPPEEAMLRLVAPALAALERRHPAWRGRIEVETVARSTVEAYASGDAAGTADAIMRVSPGEALHLLPATPHRVLTWATVREKGRPLVGPRATDVLPAVDPTLVRAALLQHVRDWPAWVEDMSAVGAQAYSVLSMCRAWCAVVEGEQRSKRAAADHVAGALPLDGELVAWARDWWYAGGSDDEPSRHAAVRDFVTRTSSRILEAADATAR